MLRVPKTIGGIAAFLLSLTTAPAQEKPAGIHVHGHWVIQVKDPDGTLKERREFENSYQGGMGAILSGRVSPADMAIAVSLKETGAGLTPLCTGACTFVVSTTAGIGVLYNCTTNADCAGGVTETVTANALTLTANVAAPRNGSFDTVYTFYNVCFIAPQTSTFSQVASSSCFQNPQAAGNAIGTLTNHSLTNAMGQLSPLTVTAGQTISFQITISFS